MNILSSIIKSVIFLLLLTATAQAQNPIDVPENNFKLSAHISTGVNYTYDYNTYVSGKYKKNSIPVLTGFELLYKDTFGLEITGGYFPVMFYSEIRQYQKVQYSIDASLIAYPISASLKYKLWNFSLSLGGSFCMLKTDISLTSSGTETIHNSFGITGALAYYFTLADRLRLAPRVSYYNIPEVGSRTISFQLRLLYNFWEF